MRAVQVVDWDKFIASSMQMSDNISELPADQRENAGADDNSTIATRLSQWCYIFVCVNILLLSSIVVVRPDIYYSIVTIQLREDKFVENFTAAAFLLSGIILIAAALSGRRYFRSPAYILGGAAMAFLAGEEISWGQRIIGFETPAFLETLNTRGEFNIHNLFEGRLLRLIQRETLSALCIGACAAFFWRKDRIFGIPSPPIPMILALLVMTYFSSLRLGGGVADYSPLIWTRALALLLLLLPLVFALFSKNAKLFIGAAASLFLVVSATYAHHYRDLMLSEYSYTEMREYLFSAVCFFYALTALLDQRVARKKITAAVAVLKPAAALLSTNTREHIPPQSTCKGKFSPELKDGRMIRNCLTTWTSVCALIIAGSIGLAFTVYIDARSDAAVLKEIYSLVRASRVEPIARSQFDVYLVGNNLYYFKWPCAAPDTAARFFLAAFPANVDDLGPARRRHGFGNFDFDFESKRQRVVSDDACAAWARLPGYYEIAGVSTGQFVVDEDGAFTNLWVAEFPVGGE